MNYVHIIHWKPRVVMTPTLSSLVVPATTKLVSWRLLVFSWWICWLLTSPFHTVIILNKYIPTWSSRLQTAVKSVGRHILNCFVNYKLMNKIPGTQIQFTWLLKCHNRFQLSGGGNWKHVTRSSFSYRCKHILFTLKRRNITKMIWAWFSVVIRHGLTVAQ